MPRRPGACPAEPTAAAARDPSRFIETALKDSAGRPLKQSAVHEELQRFLTEHRHALVELPRDHGKTAQVCGRIVWELGHNPTLRVKLVCATADRAAERSRFLRDAIEGNPFVRVVFPGLFAGTPWGAAAFSIDRPATVIDPSVSAVGVGTSSTGGRADLLVCDDIVDAAEMHSRADRQRTKDLFRHNLMNLLEPDGRFWNLFTPWHPDDLNAELKQSGVYPLFRRAVGPNLEPVWPERWSAERLAERRREIGDSSFSRGYQLANFDDAERVIKPEWVTFWDADPPREDFELVVLSVDPAATATKRSDASALVTVGRPKGSNALWVLEAVAVRVPAPELRELIDDADRRWRPDRILFESNAAFEAVRAQFVHGSAFGPRVLGVKQGKNKHSRLTALGISVQNGLVKLKGRGGFADPGQRELFDEMTSFPNCLHDDLADAMATAADDVFDRPEPRVWV